MKSSFTPRIVTLLSFSLTCLVVASAHAEAPRSSTGGPIEASTRVHPGERLQALDLGLEMLERVGREQAASVEHMLMDIMTWVGVG